MLKRAGTKQRRMKDEHDELAVILVPRLPVVILL